MDALVCIDCATRHAPDATRCPCGGALDHVAPGPTPTRADLEGSGRGVWRFARLLGVPEGHVTTLGEGATPLVHDAVLGARFKLEYTNPTGSFKDRGAAVLVSRARALGAHGLVEDSSGNAGTSVAAYAARAGLPSAIFAPEHITTPKRRQIEALGAELHVVPGPRRGVTEAAVAHAAKTGWYYASHAYPPHFIDGCATLAPELLLDLGRVPDVIVTPCAMGSILLGAFRGFDALKRAGLVERVPRLVAVQATGFDPVAAAAGHAGRGVPNRVADGLQIVEPPRRGQLVEAVRATGGTALAVDEPDTLRAMGALHRRGFLVEPSSAVVGVALERGRREEWLGRDEVVVAVLTGRYRPA